MTKKLYISSEDSKVKIALVENDLLVQIHEESISDEFKVGDIYFGKIKKIAPSLNAAFVDIGYKKDAFLHYLDLGSKVNSLKKYTSEVKNNQRDSHLLKGFFLEKSIDKTGTINQIIKSGDVLMVQVTKEPISTKGPRITSEISIPGRYIVLVPFSNQVSVSQKIKEEEERNRLKTLVQKIKPEGFGVIIRTVAEGRNSVEIQEDLNDLIDKWKKIFFQIKEERNVPFMLLNELDKTSSILRDTLNGDFSKIICDNKEITEEIKDYIKIIAPEKQKILKHYDGSLPILENFGVERQIKQSFGKIVNITKGAYLIIEHTEALHVIDVNSGSNKAKDFSQEKNAFEINLLAAKEIARQLKLRDMGGIIVVDFIDMKDKTNRNDLYELLKSEMATDKAKHKILPPSKFGLIQITRQRVRPETVYDTYEENPNGGQKIQAPILIIKNIEYELKSLTETKNNKVLNIHAHPFLIAFLKSGFLSQRIKWMIDYKVILKLTARDSFKYLAYQIKDNKAKLLSKHSN